VVEHGGFLRRAIGQGQSTLFSNSSWYSRF
jgi:hypothetical protein